MPSVGANTSLKSTFSRYIYIAISLALTNVTMSRKSLVKFDGNMLDFLDDKKKKSYGHESLVDAQPITPAYLKELMIKLQMHRWVPSSK